MTMREGQKYEVNTTDYRPRIAARQ